MESVMAFWTRHGWDREQGGMLTSVGREGELIDSDKSVWFQGRSAWMFAAMYAHTGAEEHRAVALSCCEFLREKCFGEGGKLYFTVTRAGEALRMRRYVYSESFAAIAFAACARLAGGEEKQAEYRRLALHTWDTYLRYSFTPGVMEPKCLRKTRGIGPLMIAIVTAQELRVHLGDADGALTAQIAGWIGEIERYFVKRDIACVMECVGPAGEILDHFDGRTLNPGHAIECAWFVLHEHTVTNDAHMLELGLYILDVMWKRGWDTEYGGLFYFRDVYDKPLEPYWATQKFWWPHCEAIIATLLAFKITKNPKYAQMHKTVHEYTYAKFPDRERPGAEWFGYLDRQGNPTTLLKGNTWKGPFHIPRMLLMCHQMLK